MQVDLNTSTPLMWTFLNVHPAFLAAQAIFLPLPLQDPTKYDYEKLRKACAGRESLASLSGTGKRLLWQTPALCALLLFAHADW